MNIPDPQWQGH